MSGTALVGGVVRKNGLVGSLVTVTATGSEFQNPCFSVDGTLLAVAGHNKSFVLDWKEPSHIVPFATGQRQSSVSLSPDKKSVIVDQYTRKLPPTRVPVAGGTVDFDKRFGTAAKCGPFQAQE